MESSPEIYKPTKKDLAYRPQAGFPKANQWWYHDGVFDNGYSVQVLWWVTESIARITLEIDVPDGKSIGLTIPFPRDTVSASTEHCDITMGGNRLRGEFPTYNISFHSGALGADLVYECVTQEFMEPPDGCYIGRGAVPATPKYLGYVLRPRCKITGRLIVGGKEVCVNGLGYCDHQWSNVSLAELFYYWSWGKAYLPNHTVFWWDSQLHETLGYQRTKWLWVFKGDKLFQYLRDADMFVETSELTEVDQKSGVAFPRKVVLAIDNTKVKGTLTYRIKKKVNPIRVPSPRGRVYFRYLSDCHAKLEIDGEKIESNSVELHELYI